MHFQIANSCTNPFVLADPAFDCVVPALQTKPALHKGVLMLDSPQCGNTEKANLISDWPKSGAPVQYKTVKMLHKPKNSSLLNAVYTVGTDISNVMRVTEYVLFVCLL